MWIRSSAGVNGHSSSVLYAFPELNNALHGGKHIRAIGQGEERSFQMRLDSVDMVRYKEAFWGGSFAAEEQDLASAV